MRSTFRYDHSASGAHELGINNLELRVADTFALPYTDDYFVLLLSRASAQPNKPETTVKNRTTNPILDWIDR